MATVTAPAMASPIDPQIEHAVNHAQSELTKVQNQLQREESALDQLAAQFNEQCRLQALGKKADPQACKDKMDAVEHRIIGLRSVVAERLAEFDRACLDRAKANSEQQEEVERAKMANLRKAHDDAKQAVSNAYRAVRAAEDEERRSGAELFQAIQRDTARTLGRARR